MSSLSRVKAHIGIYNGKVYPFLVTPLSSIRELLSGCVNGVIKQPTLITVITLSCLCACDVLLTVAN